ncbi:unnamed protein product, partial [Nesidiocoris tenuis]
MEPLILTLGRMSLSLICERFALSQKLKSEKSLIRDLGYAKLIFDKGRFFNSFK